MEFSLLYFSGDGSTTQSDKYHLLLETARTDDLAQQISLYRNSLAKHGHDPKDGKVALMLHTFIGEDTQTVKQKVRKHFCNYLKTHFGLVKNLAKRVNFKSIQKLLMKTTETAFYRLLLSVTLKGR